MCPAEISDIRAAVFVNGPVYVRNRCEEVAATRFRKIREGRQPWTLDGWGLPLSSEGCQRNAENTVAAMHPPMTAPASTCASV